MIKIVEKTKDWIKSIANIHRQGDKKNIFLFATPRGGSTWVMEILASQPGIKHFDEPFSIRRDNVIKAGRFNSWEDLMPDAGRDEDIINYIHDLTRNNIGVMNSAPFRNQHRFLTNRIVFKIHELEHLINKIETTFESQIVYLLRHPIPTSLSRNVLPRLELYLNSEYYRENYLTEQQINKAKQICKTGSHIQKGVLAWCLENIVPLKFSKTDDWLFVSYEEILLNPKNACEIIANKLDYKSVNLMLDTVDRPAVNIKMSASQTTDILADSDAERRRKNMVTKWESRIVDEDEKQCFEIMELFELDTYSLGSYIAHERYILHPETLKINDEMKKQ